VASEAANDLVGVRLTNQGLSVYHGSALALRRCVERAAERLASGEASVLTESRRRKNLHV